MRGPVPWPARVFRPLRKDWGAGQHRRMKETWTIDDLNAELERFEQAARSAGLADNSVRTYVDRSRVFLRWLTGDFQFQGPRL